MTQFGDGLVVARLLDGLLSHGESGHAQGALVICEEIVDCVFDAVQNVPGGEGTSRQAVETAGGNGNGEVGGAFGR